MPVLPAQLWDWGDKGLLSLRPSLSKNRIPLTQTSEGDFLFEEGGFLIPRQDWLGQLHG
jgi:hypothetical protein